MPAQSAKSEAAELIAAAHVTNGDGVFDADALFAEFKNDTKPFVFGGERFTMPHPNTWPDEAAQAAMKGDGVEFCRTFLGAEQYERFTKLGGNARFLQKIVEGLFGATLGEFSASSSS